MATKITVTGAYVRSGEGVHLHGQTFDADDKLAARWVELGVAEKAGNSSAVSEGLGDDPSDDALRTGKVDDLLAWVGDDKDRAGRVLAVERGEGGKDRSSLVDKLKPVAG